MRFLAILTLVSGSALAQTAQITGRTADSLGSVIPGVIIKVVNENTRLSSNTATNSEGYYTFPLLQPGNYQISAEKQGFRPMSLSHITLEVEEVSRIDFALEIGHVTDRIQVPSFAPMIEPETSTAGQVINNKTIVEMPLNGRNSWDLSKLSGATLLIASAGDAGEVPVATIGGSRTRTQSYMIDGGSVQKSGLATAQAELEPMIDAVEEFKVITNNYAAEFGRTAGGVFTAVTKSGTNQFRGNAFEFLRNDAFDARNFFAIQKAPLHYNQFGGTIGGPIRRNRTFFFVGLETTELTRGVTTILTVPTVAQRNGDFSALTDASGKAVPIYDPFTTRPNPNDPTTSLRDPFPRNIIPQSEIDPVSRNAAAYYALPNQSGNLAGGNNYNLNVNTSRTQYHGTARFDHELSTRDKLFARYITQYNSIPEANVYPVAAASGVGPNSRNITNLALTWLTAWTRIVSPQMINDLRVGGTDQYRDLLHVSYNRDWPDKLGLAGVGEAAFPIFRPQGYDTLGAAGGAFRKLSNPYYQILDGLTYSRGQHNWKFGFEYRHNSTTDRFLLRPSGDFFFAVQGTGLQENPSSGNGFATMLLGFATQAQMQNSPNFQFNNKSFGVYAQDDWKVSQTLTLNIGLRYDVETPRISPESMSNSFNPHIINPVAGVPGVVRFAGVDGEPNNVSNTQFGDIAPRFGFAWRPLGADRTVVRGGFGMFFGNPDDMGFNNTAVIGFGTQALLVSPDQNQTPALLLKNGFPATPALGPQDRNNGFGVGGPVDFYERNRPTPYSMQFNVGVQHEWRSVLFEAEYLGNLGRHLTAPNLSMNQVAPDLIGGAGSIQSRRPFPQFTAVTIDSPNFGASSYHALLVRSEKRYRNGLQFLVNYTFSKFIDNVDAIAGGDYGGLPTSYEDFYNRKLDKALSPNDITHAANFNVIYELPMGRGKRWLQDGLWSYVLGGWQLSTLAIARTGAPFGVTALQDSCECFAAGQQRADILRDPALPGNRRSIAEWFDTSAFTQPGRFQFGTSARAVGRAPGSVNFDAGVMKYFPIHEQIRIQFRGELFNLFNHPNFGMPNTMLGAPNFGAITTAADGRIIQLSLKLYF
jgi:hypothetical protein